MPKEKSPNFYEQYLVDNYISKGILIPKEIHIGGNERYNYLGTTWV